MNILVVEDEPISAKELVSLIRRYDKTFTVGPVIDTIVDCIKTLKKDEPDLLFLDIQLADGLSFEIFDHMEVECPIVFTTAYDQYAVKAFEQNSISYLLKPITYSKLKSVFEKYADLKRMFKSDLDRISLKVENYKTQFLVKSGRRLIPIKAKHIEYFESKDNLTWISTLEGKKYLSGHSLNDLESLLRPEDFLRVNRKYIVARESVSHLEGHRNGQVKLIMINGKEAVISRQKTPDVKDWLS